MSDERPGILTAIAIIGIILGSLGVLGGLMSAAGAFVQGQLPADAPAGSEAELTARIVEATQQYMVWTILGAVANLVVSALLIVGGAMLLNRKPVAVGLMTSTAVAALVVDLYNAGAGAYVQMKVMPLTQELARATAAGMPGGDAAAMDTIMAGAMWVGIAVTVVWLLCKLAYYIVTFVALKRPAVKDWVTAEAVV